MAKAWRVGERIQFHCKGCNRIHEITDGKGGWGFNNNFDLPTFTPSVLVKGTQFMTDEEYKRIADGEKIEPKPLICHSFVTDGKIKYLNDCTHDLAGQTIDLPEDE